MKAIIAELLAPVLELRPIHRGYTPAARAIAQLADGRRVFVKHAVHDSVVERLRFEHQIYEQLGPQPFMPALIAWRDGDRPLLVLEDLSDLTWPPPWDVVGVQSVLSTLEAVAACDVPNGLRDLGDTPAASNGWAVVLDDPAPFLSLGHCSESWLEHAGPILAEAAGTAPLAGTSLLHSDVRSDNLCLLDSAAKLVDWDSACVGNPAFDEAFWLPSLAAEGGPPPSEVMPDCPVELVAFVAGFFAARAGLPLIPHAPRVREVQLAQLCTALPWAREVFNL